MKTSYLLRPLLVALLSCPVSYLAAQTLWRQAPREAAASLLQRTNAAIPADGQFDLFQLDMPELQRRMSRARTSPDMQGRPVTHFTIELPQTGGGSMEAEAEESSIVSEAIRQQIPDVRTYLLRDKSNGSSLGRITLTGQGITGLLFTKEGTAYIHPLDGGNNYIHITYYTRSIQLPQAVQCALAANEADIEMGARDMAGKTNAGDCQLRTYRLAVAATGEYFQWAGSSQANALAYITICINTVNAIFERDASIRFTLVTTNSIIYTDPATDPYGTTLDGALLTANNNATDAALGAGNYDIGIVFNNGWSGGLAQLNSVCTINHGRSAAGLTFGTGANPTPGPQGPVFDGTVAHEIAHQFSATHTMAANNGGCLGNTTSSSAWEPGGGSTIMAYAGTCTGNAYQWNSDLYFHAGNMMQISNYATNLAGNSCPLITPLGNIAPDVSVASSAYTIPVSTPFFLSAVGTDADANALTYTWEQMNANAITSSPPSATATTGPNFRPFPPSQSPIRYFPNLPALVSGTATPYEVLPSVARTMNFRVNVRDNASGGGCNVQEDVAVTTHAAGGPFIVTSQNTPVSLTADGSNTFTITWNVAGTDVAPFNTSQVDILFSADGGVNFNYVLLSGTANDGTETILVPNVPTVAGRIMVRAAGNIFFNVNAAAITIASSCPAEGAMLQPETIVTAAPGSPALNLAVAPNFGTVLLPTSGASLTASDPASTLAVYSSVTSGCVSFSNEYRYDEYRFQVNVSGNYIFQKTAGNYIMNLYSGAFNPSSPCLSFMASNGTFNGTNVAIGSTLTATLTAGVPYTLTAGTFNSTTPAKPFSYTISLSAAPPGGNVYTGYPDPGAGYGYAYVIVNNSTGNIVEIRSTPDLSNSSTYTSGIFTVYGFSYEMASFSPGDLEAYEGGPFSALSQDLLSDPASHCGNISKNQVTVNVFGILPVEWLPLTASPEGEQVRLRWATEQEWNSHYFDVEHSVDGRLFEPVGTVPAAGVSTSRRNYQWLHASPSIPGNYYRIKSVNQEGVVQYSNIVTARIASGHFRVQAYPNPLHQQTELRIKVPAATKITIRVFNSNGTEILQQAVQLAAGHHVVPLNLTRHPSGSYLVVVESGGWKESVKLIKKM